MNVNADADTDAILLWLRGHRVSASGEVDFIVCILEC